MVTARRLEGFDHGHDTGDHEDAAHRLKKSLLRQLSGEPSTEERPGDRRACADPEQPPVDARGRMTDHAGDPHPEAGGHVRADRPRRRLAQPADDRGHAEAAEDESDEPSQEADAERVWDDRQGLIDDVRWIAEELTAVADDAGVRFPVEPEAETTPLPELPPMPPPDAEVPPPPARPEPPE